MDEQVHDGDVSSGELLDASELDSARENPTRVIDALAAGLPSSDPIVMAIVPEDFDEYGGLGKDEWEKRRFPVFRGSDVGVTAVSGRIWGMRDTELYRRLLGLETPWKVGRVELSATDGLVDVWVPIRPARTRFACPDCDAVLSVYDHSAERAWRHLDSCAFSTFLHASPPRVDGPEHGVIQIKA